MEWHPGMVAELAQKWGCSAEHVHDLLRVVDAILADALDPKVWGPTLSDFAIRGLRRIYAQDGRFDSVGAGKMLEVIQKMTGVGAAQKFDVTSNGRTLGALPATAEALLGELLALNPTPEEVEAFSTTGVLPRRAPKAGAGSNGAPTQH